MYQPVLVTPASVLPVTLEEAKEHLRIDDADTSENALVTAYIKAAVASIEQYYCAVSEQTWRQSFDTFWKVFRLSRYPVIGVPVLKYRPEGGADVTVAQADYSVLSDEIGPFVRIKDGFDYPSSLYETGAVTLEWKAGFSAGAIPENIRVAILLIVGDLYQNREAKVENSLQENQAVGWLLSPYRSWRV